jgi:hypothetical protein
MTKKKKQESERRLLGITGHECVGAATASSSHSLRSLGHLTRMSEARRRDESPQLREFEELYVTAICI